MKREEEIKKAGSEYTENYDCFDGDIDDIEIGFIDGAVVADGGRRSGGGCRKVCRCIG